MKPLAFVVLLLLLGCSKSKPSLQAGDSALDFTLMADSGGQVSLSSLYPRRLCIWRLHLPNFKPQGFRSWASASMMSKYIHQKFKSEHRLNFRLLSDTEHRIGLACRVPFLIDHNGLIHRIFNDVAPDARVGEVLAIVKTL